MNKKWTGSVLFFVLLFSGCQLGPRYEPPVTETEEAWKSDTHANINVPQVDYWWEVFSDCTLNELESQALAGNPNLYAALDRVAQARALAGIELADLYPQINLNPVYTNTGILFKIFAPKGVFPVADDSILKRPFRIHQQLYTLPFNMNYELDIWGKLRGQYRSALYATEAEKEKFHAIMLTLTADVASSYFQTRLLDTQIEIVHKNIGLLKRTLTLTEARKNKGLVSELDIVSIQQLLFDTEGTLNDLKKQRSIQENILATLIGVPPAVFCMEINPLLLPPPQVPPNMPSEVLLQRPDIAAAERMMASEHALIGVAYASFFPSIQLTGSLGYSSPTFQDFLTWHSRLWSIGANALQTILDGGRNIANVNMAYARYNEAAHDYQQQVLTAFQEVENALASLEWEAKQYESYFQGVEASRKRQRLANRRYSGGLTSSLDLIDSERTVLQAELNASGVLGLRYISTIQLIKAIGGGWPQEQLLECED